MYKSRCVFIRDSFSTPTHTQSLSISILKSHLINTRHTNLHRFNRILYTEVHSNSMEISSLNMNKKPNVFDFMNS
jgi:hypothetical protein